MNQKINYKQVGQVYNILSADGEVLDIAPSEEVALGTLDPSIPQLFDCVVKEVQLKNTLSGGQLSTLDGLLQIDQPDKLYLWTSLSDGMLCPETLENYIKNA